MPEYRFYRINQEGHVAEPAPIVECPDDLSAVREARQYVDGCDVEVWQGPRVVAYVTPETVRKEG